jgi:hypothetical protein
MDELQKYLDAIRENGDLRRAEARKLTDRLRRLFDRIGSALHDAGVWGDQMEYILEKELDKYGERRTYTVLRPSLEKYHPDPISPEKKEVVVIDTQEIVYNLAYENEETRETKHRLTALPVDEGLQRRTLYISGEGENFGVDRVRSGIVTTGVAYTRVDEEDWGQEAELAKRSNSVDGDWYVHRVLKRNRDEEEGSKHAVKLHRWDQETPFVPRRLAVKIAEQLPEILERFSGYVEGLAVETEEARKSTEAITVGVS